MTPSSPALRRHERRERLIVLALLSPALAVVTALLVVPLAWLAVQSVTADGAFTLEHYRRFLTEDIYWRSFLLTFRIALTVTVLALLSAIPWLSRQRPCRGAGASWCSAW